MDVSKVTISGYASSEIAQAAKHAADLAGQKLASWVSIAIEEKLERDGMTPAQIAENRSLVTEVQATVEIAGRDRVKKSLARLRSRLARERAPV
tara:strand:+ start:349 stop:630 length:282 start_codon:yes stop_codon:yes gene_type:complete